MSQPSDEQIRDLLRRVRTIAVVGLSSDPSRPSHHVATYLLDQGYRIIPINPMEAEILGQRCYPSLADLPGPVDLIDVFRRPDAVPGLVEAALRLPEPRPALWLQEGITHPEAEATARTAGMFVVSDRCILKDHLRLLAAI